MDRDLDLFGRYLTGELDEDTRLLICDSIENDPQGVLATKIREHKERVQSAFNINFEALVESLLSEHDERLQDKK